MYPGRWSAVLPQRSAEEVVRSEMNDELPDLDFEVDAEVRTVVSEGNSPSRGPLLFAIACSLTLGVLAGGTGFWLLSEPPPTPAPIIETVEVPVEVIKVVEVPVEVIKFVEVPVEVIKIVEVPVEVIKIVEVPAPQQPRPSATPAPEVEPERPAIAVVIKPLVPKLGPMPSGVTILDRTFARSRPGSHSRRVEILEYTETGVVLRRELRMARLHRGKRTVTLGIVTPVEFTGTGETRILSIETGKLEDQRFGFRPASGELERLHGGRGANPFGDSAFRFDDFRMRSSDQFVIHQVDRAKVKDAILYVVSAKPRFRADYERVEFIVDAQDFALLESHYFKGLGLRPYRILQYPRDDMKLYGDGLVPTRVISRDLANGVVEEARLVSLKLSNALDSKLFTLPALKGPGLRIPNL